MQAKSRLGAFAYSEIVNKEDVTVLENDILRIVVANKGGQITEVELKQFKTYDQKQLFLIKENAKFELSFSTVDNRVLNTKDLGFAPVLTKQGDDQILSMRLKVSENQYLEYTYTLKANDYMLDFSVKSQGLKSVINTSTPINLLWNLKGLRHEKSIKYEDQNTALYYENDEEVDDLSIASDDNETENTVKWVAFKQHFFSSILLSNDSFKNASLVSTKLMNDEKIDTVYTKEFLFTAPLELKSGELDYDLNMYYGPNDHKILSSYNKNIEEVIELGWGLFGFINEQAFFPIFDFLKGFISNYGLLIILMTIAIKLIMSPLLYKSFVSSAKMKVIRPEIEEVNKRLPGKENAMKRQQETMAIQRKAGVSMMAGCIPALLQMPVFFALFRFFPANIDIRQKSFLWATDLSAYDEVLKLPFYIPFYGDHISLFPILASVAIFFYMRMSQSQQSAMQQPAQEGMPDMKKMMKMMMYISPLMMLFFFNNYGSGLSLYYFISNLLTIGIMLVIKYVIIDEDKIHAIIQENKAKPEKKKSKFREKLDAAMKQAQEQQKQKGK